MLDPLVVAVGSGLLGPVVAGPAVAYGLQVLPQRWRRATEWLLIAGAVVAAVLADLLSVGPVGGVFVYVFVVGSGPVQINSRVVTGVTSDSANPVAYQPRSASCSLGTLVATKAPPSGVALGAAAAREAQGMPATAALTVTSGAASPLAGQTLFLLRDSFGTALTKGGFRPPRGMTPIKGWATVCTASQPSCQQAADATSQNSIAMARVDGSGRAQFPAVPAASYYVFAAAMHNSKLVMWNKRVDLKAGANSVTLDLSDAAPIE